MYAYLSPLAQRRLSLIRDLARQSAWLRSSISPLDTGRFVLFPWTGSRIHKTLAIILQSIDWFHTQSNDAHYYVEFVYKGSAADALNELRALSPRVPDLVSAQVSELKDMELWQGKYDFLTPRQLLEKAYINDALDIPGTMQWLATCS
jgi:hypothetical protein